ncbi:MAG: MarR family transcriptional regulator [Myxococcota bacterium]
MNNDRGRRLEGRILRVCDAVGAFIEYWGFKAIHGRIWTLLALRDGPMTQIEIAQTLKVSRSLVSGSIAELLQLSLVRATEEHRNAPYEAVVDIWSTVSDVLRGREWMLVESARLALEGALEEVHMAAQSGQSSRYNAERLRMLLNMTEVAQALLHLLIRMRSARSLEGASGWIRRATRFLGKNRLQ